MRVTVYIRRDNEDKWATIENKSDWLNSVLDGQETTLERKVRRMVKEMLPGVLEELQGL
jgi:hypothetical protein